MVDLFGGDPEEYDDDDGDEDILESIDPPAEVFGHPRDATFSLGYDNIERRLLDLHAQDRLPHGFIFSGTKGIGKATFAYRFARFLFKNGVKDSAQDSLFGAPEPQVHTSIDVPATDIVFSRVASGGHPDMLTIERQYDTAKDRYKNSVEVDEVRKVAPFLRKTAAEGGWRVVIIDDADTMNRNAQNALLKILEEPPANTILILIAHTTGSLIPTIKSRTQTFHFDTPSDEIFKELLNKAGVKLSADEYVTLQKLSSGSFGQARALIEGEALQMSGKFLDLLGEYNWQSIHSFADSLGNLQDSLELFADVTHAIFSQMAQAKARGQQVTGFGVHRAMIQKMADGMSLADILAINDNLENHFTKVEVGNLDKKQAVLTAFSLIS